MALKNKVQLITYPNRLGKNLEDLFKIIGEYFPNAIGGVHILPVYPSNADEGFSPLTHKEVNPAYGTWEDVERISSSYDLCLDLMINHISDESKEFKDFVEKGHNSEYADLFVHVDNLEDISPDDLAKIYIRKEKEPFREVKFSDGTLGHVWCTFTEHQIDLNYNNPKAYKLMEDYIRFLTARGVKLFRLDAFGYTTKRIGTTCFLLEPDVYEILSWINRAATENGAEVLPEVHDHSSYQFAIGMRGMRPYGFALPVLMLHALLDSNARYLKHWLRICPRHQITVLDTHDGICIPDAEGFLPDTEVQHVIHNVSERSHDPILRRSAADVRSVGAIYQLTSTYYDALKRNDDAYIAARAIQFFAPGIPQVHYVGLLAGENDVELADRTGDSRDVNRHYYTEEEIREAVSRPIVKRLLKLMDFRNNYPAFGGQFELHSSNDSSIHLSWMAPESWCELFVDLLFKRTTIRYLDPRSKRTLTIHC